MTKKDICASMYKMLHENWQSISVGNKLYIKGVNKYLITKSDVGSNVFVYEIDYWCNNCESYKWFMTVENHLIDDSSYNNVSETVLRHLSNEIADLINNY